MLSQAKGLERAEMCQKWVSITAPWSLFTGRVLNRDPKLLEERGWV